MHNAKSINLPSPLMRISTIHSEQLPNARAIPQSRSTLAVEIAPESPLEFRRALTQDRTQVIQIIPSSDPEFPHKILGCILEIAVVLSVVLVFLASEVGVGRYR